MRYALVEGGVVVQIDVTDRHGFVSVADSVAPGFLFDGTKFSAPPPRVPSGIELAGLISDECERRIFAVVDTAAQQRLKDHYMLGKLTTAEQATYRDGVQWIDDMVVKCRALVATGDTTFAADRHWPVPDAAIVELAKRF